LSSDWYAFHHGIGAATVKPSDRAVEADVLLLLPIGRSGGITGELKWSRSLPFPDDPLPALGAPVVGGQRAVREAHERLVAALRAAGAVAGADVMADVVQTSIRDYVADTGTLVALDGRAALREHCDGFFSKFEVQSVDVLSRVA